jgi:hypothetical protein
MTRPLAAAVALVCAVVLGGCAQDPLPQPRPQEAAAATPVVGGGQLDRVLAGVVETMTAADAALDPALLAPRVAGPAVELRTAGYTVRRALPGNGVITPVGGQRLVDVVPQEQEWPRTVMSVTQAAADDAVPELLLLTQAGPRDPYVLTAWASLLPGVTVPTFAPAGEGVQVPPVQEAGSLALAPADVVARYADVLTTGPGSQFAAGFGPDAFSAQVLSEQETERQSATVTCPGCFSYAVAHAPRADATWTLGTADGGAVVLGVLDSTRSLTVAAAGAKLPLVEDFAVLSGKTEAVSSASFTSVEVVAFLVPPAGSTDPVTVLASERALTAATAS